MSKQQHLVVLFIFLAPHVSLLSCCERTKSPQAIIVVPTKIVMFASCSNQRVKHEKVEVAMWDSLKLNRVIDNRFGKLLLQGIQIQRSIHWATVGSLSVQLHKTEISSATLAWSLCWVSLNNSFVTLTMTATEFKTVFSKNCVTAAWSTPNSLPSSLFWWGSGRVRSQWDFTCFIQIVDKLFHDSGNVVMGHWKCRREKGIQWLKPWPLIPELQRTRELHRLEPCAQMGVLTLQMVLSDHRMVKSEASNSTSISQWWAQRGNEDSYQTVKGLCHKLCITNKVCNLLNLRRNQQWFWLCSSCGNNADSLWSLKQCFQSGWKRRHSLFWLGLRCWLTDINNENSKEACPLSFCISDDRNFSESPKSWRSN